MKKSVILIIAIVYLASVLIVGLMGLEMRIYNSVVYINQINYQVSGKKDEDYLHASGRESYKKTANGGYSKEYLYVEAYSVFNAGDAFIEENYVENLTIELKFSIVPANATNKNLKYSILEDDKYKINGEVVTDKNVKPKDGDIESGWVIMKTNSDGNVELTFKKPSDVQRVESLRVIVTPAGANTATRSVYVDVRFD